MNTEPFLTLVIPNEPVAKGRGRIGFIKSNTHRPGWTQLIDRKWVKPMIFTPPETKNYESEIKLRAKTAMGMARLQPTDRPLYVEVIAFKPMPESKSETWKAFALLEKVLPTLVPDGDNYFKAATDGCNEVVWLDDCQITDHSFKKRYSDNPRLEIRVYIIDAFRAQENPKKPTSQSEMLL